MYIYYTNILVYLRLELKRNYGRDYYTNIFLRLELKRGGVEELWKGLLHQYISEIGAKKRRSRGTMHIIHQYIPEIGANKRRSGGTMQGTTTPIYF